MEESESLRRDVGARLGVDEEYGATSLAGASVAVTGDEAPGRSSTRSSRIAHFAVGAGILLAAMLGVAGMLPDRRPSDATATSMVAAEAAAKSDDRADQFIGGSCADCTRAPQWELSGDDSMGINKHTRSTPLLEEDAEFMHSYFVDYASGDSSTSSNGQLRNCEENADRKFNANNIALHFVDNPHTLGDKNTVTARTVQDIADAGGEYTVWHDDATGFYVSDLSEHTTRLYKYAEETGRPLIARHDQGWYTLIATTPSGRAMHIISRTLSDVAKKLVGGFKEWKSAECVSAQAHRMDGAVRDKDALPQRYVETFGAGESSRSNGLPQLLVVDMASPVALGNIKDLRDFYLVQQNSEFGAFPNMSATYSESESCNVLEMSDQGTTSPWLKQARLKLSFIENKMASGSEGLAAVTNYVQKVHECTMQSTPDRRAQGWNAFMDNHYGFIDTHQSLGGWEQALLDESISYHSHKKGDNKTEAWDTLHIVSPGLLPPEANGYYSAPGASYVDPMDSNGFDWCTWSTEADVQNSEAPSLEECDGYVEALRRVSSVSAAKK